MYVKHKEVNGLRSSEISLQLDTLPARGLEAFSLLQRKKKKKRKKTKTTEMPLEKNRTTWFFK